MAPRDGSVWMSAHPLACAVPPYLEDATEEGGSTREDLLNLHHWLCP